MRKRIMAGVVAALIIIGILVARRHEVIRFAIAESIGLATGYQVQIGDQRLGFDHGALLHVRVTRNGDPVLEAARIDIWYSLRDLLPGSSHRYGITAIALYQPNFTIERYKDGSYNIRFPEAKAAVPGPPSPPNRVPFRMTVRIRGLGGALRDPAAVDPSARTIRIANVNLDASIDTATRTHYTLRGDFEEAKPEPFAASGTVDETRGYAMHRLRAAKFPMQAIGNFIVNSDAARILGGDARNLDVRAYALGIQPFAPIAYHLGGTMNVSDARMAIVGLREPLDHIVARLELVDGTLFARNLTATLANIPVHGAGALFNFGSLQYRFGVSGYGDLAQLRNALVFSQGQPISGEAHIGLLIEGATNGPLLVANAQAPHVTYDGIAFTNMNARVALNNGVVAIAPLNVQADGARFAVGGTLTLGESVQSKLVVHAVAPADRLPYMGMVLGSEPLVIDALGLGTGTKFHARAAIASARGVARAAALVGLEPDGEVDVAPFWVHTERGSFDASYQLDRKTNSSAFWLLARGFHLHVPTQLPFTGTVVPVLPPIAGTIDRLALAGGGPSGTAAAIAGSLSARSLRVAGVPIDALSGSFAGTLAGANVNRLTASGPWGSLAGRGQVSTTSLIARGAYRGTLAGLRPFIGNVAASGNANGTVALSIARNRIVVQAQHVQLQNAVVHGVPVTSASGTVAIDSGLVHVYGARVGAAGGEIVASGAYGAQTAASRELTLVGTNLDAAHLRGLGLPLDAGTVTVSGRIAPGATIPQFAGGVTVAHGRVQGDGVDGAGLVALNGDAATLSHVVGDLNGAYALVGGRVAALSSGAPTYALQAHVPAADLARTLQTLNIAGDPSEGTYNADLTVGGRGLDPSVRGRLAVPAGFFNGLPFANGQAQIQADRLGLVARHGSVVVGRTFARFAGATRPRISALYIDAPHADLSDFNNFFDTGDTLDGSGPVRLVAISALHRIRTSGNVNVAGFRYRNLPIGDTHAVWSSARDTLRGSVDVGGPEGMLHGSGSIALVPSSRWQNVLRNSTYDLSGSLDDLDLSLWVAALGFQSVPVTGRAFGTAQLHGRYPHLAVAENMQLRNGTVGPLPIQNAQMSVLSQGARLAIQSASLSAPGIEASATGSVGVRANDPLNLDVHATSNDLPRLVTTFTRAPLDVSGDFEANMHVGGTYRAPTFAGGFDAQNVNLYGLPVASLFGAVRLRGKSVELSNAGLTFARGEATLAGSLPLEINPFAIGPSNAPVSFTLGISNLDPAIFDPVLRNNTTLGGTIDGVLGIGGTVAAPRISGRFGIKDGSYTSGLERVPVTHAAATLTFNRTQATVDNFRGQLGSGSVDGNGRISFANGFGSAAYDVKAVANSAQLDMPAFGSGTLDAKLALQRAAGARAILSGTATLSNATIPFSAFLTAMGATNNGASPIDLGFDLHVAAAKNVRVRGGGYGAGLDIGATGAVDLAGTLAAPTLAGRFTSTGGTLTYFDRAFQVRQGDVRFRPSNGIVPTLHAVGETNVVNPDPNIARNPYGSVAITIDVSGQLDNLKVAFDSNPPGYTRDQIIALIAPFGGFINGIQFSQVGAPPASGMGPLGLAPLPGTGLFQGSTGTITVGQEAFNILNAQFA
ncbi:MAG: translocation/assembly module TamB domain-containing protein, partial [Vulcanimicrobiaceae bacterium]